MASEEDWLFRPVLRGLVKYESLLEGKVRLVDIAKLNEALDIETYNQYLASAKT